MKCMHQIYFCGKLNYRVCVCECGHGVGGGGEGGGVLLQFNCESTRRYYQRIKMNKKNHLSIHTSLKEFYIQRQLL